MITTKQVNVDLGRGQKESKFISTKDVDASIKIEPPKEPVKVQRVSTHTMVDVADIEAKRKRDDITAQRKATAEKKATKPKLYAGKLWKELTDEEKEAIRIENLAKARAAKKVKK